MIPVGLLWRGGAALALVLALLGGVRWIYSSGFDAGEQTERNASLRAAEARRREDQRVASEMVDEARKKTQAAQDVAAQLQQEIGRGRIALVRAPQCRAGAAAGVPRAGGDAAAFVQPPASIPSGGDPQLQDELPGGSGLRLTADAVRLWNSAIAGAMVPAGACGAAGGTDGACADEADISLEEAWSNHVENAKRCSIDRTHHRQLIRFIKARQEAASAPSN